MPKLFVFCCWAGELTRSENTVVIFGDVSIVRVLAFGAYPAESRGKAGRRRTLGAVHNFYTHFLAAKIMFYVGISNNLFRKSV